MLTKDDLKAIDEMLVRRIDEVITRRINELVPTMIDKALRPIKMRLGKVERLLHAAIDLLDKDIVEVKKRVDKIEWRFGTASS